MTSLQVSCENEMIVHWGDCDAAGISYYAKNFEWFTNSYMHLLAFHGFPYMETFHARGISLVCLKADCQYKKMLRPLERISIRTSLASLTRTRLTFEYQLIKQDGELAAYGMTSHAYANQKGLPMNLKKSHPELWELMVDKWQV
ncbi:acyl-CoA thioesterase [Cytobacillus sp. NCCP-133]|uniref:acyl-CoA thioesterase n=1 Tax=Cytobacillus sp. NCCP-133 TaxID=766848 RepID=UPI00222F7316|nr:acyl-CoA thioesterase [Cytobacillus sp. NCCP-133]GLB59171.1 hypothetical protein NCCP133_13040 [Cytobacillus sp. NCCP-133]